MGTPAAVKPPVALPSVQEFSIRVPKNTNKRHNVMRFNATLKVDFSEWTQVKMERENNMKEYKGIDEDMPKFGAGSEFGRDAREEARRKKFGITSRKYKPDDQPWILKSGGRTGKKFKGTREGGVSENAAYYVFTHAPDGAIEAFPLHEWYNFQPIQRYKALSAEEAEQEFSRRNQVMNYFSLMMRKRLRNEEDGEEGEDGELAEGGRKGGKKPAKKEKELKISEMDEWMESDDDDDSDSDAEKEKKGSDDEADAKKKKKGKNAVAKKKKKKVSDDEAFEESDDGDEEGKECDYISDSSDAESEGEQHSKVKSVAEEDALRKLLASDEEEEDEEQAEKKEDESSDEDDENKEKNEKDKDKSGKDQDRKKDKKKKKKASKKKESKKASPTKDSSSDFSSDSASEPESAPKEKDNRKSNSAHSSRSATPTPAAAAAAVAAAAAAAAGAGGSGSDPLKRKQTSSPDLSQSKKLKLDNFNLVPSTSYIPGTSESGITEDAVRRYLMRKPMTTTELLQKFKSKKTGLTSEQLVNVMTQILKRINPMKQTFKNKMYLSIKATM